MFIYHSSFDLCPVIEQLVILVLPAFVEIVKTCSEKSV